MAGRRAFPAERRRPRALFAEREIDIGFTFNPGDASAAIEKGELPETVRSFGLLGGTIGNAHFLAIPRNASSEGGRHGGGEFPPVARGAGAKSRPRVWGDPTVLSAQKMAPEERARFDALPRGKADILRRTRCRSSASRMRAGWRAWRRSGAGATARRRDGQRLGASMVISLAPLLLIAILLLPVAAGVAGTLLPALGLMPAVGPAEPGLASFARLAEVPGLWRAALLSSAPGLPPRSSPWRSQLP